MGTVQINGVDYEVMGSLDGAKQYLAAAVTSGAAAWNALPTDDRKAAFLVAATRLLHRKAWSGTPSAADQVTAFPRDGLVDPITGEALPDGTTPQNAVFAEYELAAHLVGNSSSFEAQNAGSNVKRMAAKGVEMEFFRGTDVDAPILPPVVMDLLGGYLGASGSVARSSVSGACGESHFDTSGTVVRYDRNEPW